MKQLEIIQRLRTLLPTIKGVDVALLYGSFGRNEPTPNSDIDIQLLVSKDFRPLHLVNILREEFSSEVRHVTEVSLRAKVVAYFHSWPKTEFSICKDLSEVDRNYLGSEINEIESTILFAKRSQEPIVKDYLSSLISDYRKKNGVSEASNQVSSLIDKFVYEFESCSVMHRRSDGYQFYFFYNVALQVAVQLNHLTKGHGRFKFLPKHFIANVLTKDEQVSFYGLKGTLFLPEANKQKRRLLDFTYASVRALAPREKAEKLEEVCEWIYNRDFFWNFRDISTFNPKLKSGLVYRTATLSLFQDDIRFDQILKQKGISTIIDLRADREIAELPYSDKSLSKFNYVKAPFDPWNQPGWYIKNHHQGTSEEIAYRFFAIGCNNKIKAAFEAIAQEESGAIAIHCFAGKDRTGILVSMLHLLAGTTMESIYHDYLASESDVRLERLDLVLNVIKDKGGIEPYLLFCGLSHFHIAKLKQKLLNS
ncbi:MAG: tyrosine-protein phosphatase [Imperialibacter sp.]